MKNKGLLFSIFLFLSVGLIAQEMILPATILTDRAVNGKHGLAQAKDDVLLELPFVDDFSADHFPGNVDGNDLYWENRMAVLNRGLGLNQPTTGVVSFDGTNEVGYPYAFDSGSGPADTLTSCPINLDYDTDDGIGISFYYQPQGNSFFPPNATSDSLILEFYSPDLDEWFWAWSTIDLSTPNEFTFVHIPITDSRFLQSGFKFRFRNIAFLTGLFSVWNIDYVWVDQNNINDNPIVNDVAFVEAPISFLEQYSAIPLSHYENAPANNTIEGFEVLFRNLNDLNRTLEQNEIIISHEGAIVDVISNTNEPPISAQSSLPYAHSLQVDGSQYAFDTSLADDELVFDVEINLGTVDFAPTSSNNSFRFKQTFFTHYAYDDGQAEAAYAIAGSGSRMALKYNNLKSDSVWALRIYTMPSGFDFENTSFTIKVWEDNGGVPGAELASVSRQITYGQEEYHEVILYQFDEPVFVPSGTFFIGFQQSSQAAGVRVGLDRNTQGNEGNLLFNEGNGWQTTTIAAEASVMMHPLFTTEGYEDIVASTADASAIEGLKIYPNPASSNVFITSESSGLLEATIMDLSGRIVQQAQIQNSLDVSNLTSGMYLVKLIDFEGRTGTKKLIIER
jgi:hypothetical protein